MAVNGRSGPASSAPATWGSTTSSSMPSCGTSSWSASSTPTPGGPAGRGRATTRGPSTDHRELIGQVDVASVRCRPSSTSRSRGICLEAGISVLVEKPMTPTLEEARELFAHRARTRVVLHVGPRRAVQRRRAGAAQDRRRAPILIESRRLGPFVPRVQNDTVVMDLMIHDIDIVLGLVDARSARIAAAGAPVHSGRADVANVQILFECGDHRHHHRQPGHRGEDPHARHHPARRLHRRSTTRTRTSRSTGAPRRSTR